MPRGLTCASCARKVAATPGADLDLTFSEEEQQHQLESRRSRMIGLSIGAAIAWGLFALMSIGLLPPVALKVLVYAMVGGPVGAVFDAIAWRGYVRRKVLRERYQRGEIPARDFTPPTPERAAAELRRHTRQGRLKIAVIVAPLSVIAVIQLLRAFPNAQPTTADEPAKEVAASSTGTEAQAAALLGIVVRNTYNGSFKGVHEESHFELVGAGRGTNSGELAVTIVLPDKMKVHVVFAGGETIDHVLDGAMGWTRRGGAIEELTPERVAELRLELERHPDAVLTFLRAGALSMDLDATIDGGQHKVPVITIGSDRIAMFVDVATKRLRRIVATSARGPISEELTGHDVLANVRGIRVAATRVTTGHLAIFDADGTLTERLQVVTRNPMLTAEDIARPTQSPAQLRSR